MESHRVVKSYADAKKVSPDEMVLLEVPGQYARAVYWLVNTLSNPEENEMGQLVKTLMAASNPAPQ
ncbi:hypothetical protein [Ruegeria sp. SCP11]|uniref:hypothetical protein n=1 Tax=Ruegeria sp. SCP11 TaxID=3141378 RepID=UPI0033379D57